MKKVVPSNGILIPDTAQLVFHGEIFDVYQWPQVMFDGSEATFEMLRRPDTVSVICLTDKGVLVIDDEQPYTGSRKSFPGGRVDLTDETIEAAAQREVLEETGYSFKNWRLVKVGQPHMKIEWFVHILLAWDVTNQQPPQLDSGEKITVHELSFEELKQLVINKSGYLGETTDLFKDAKRLEDLQAIPEYSGRTIER